jgi:cytochrome c oxidase subunit I+III
MGMPRRVYTYPEGLGWDLPNMLSTVGAFAFAAGVLVVLVDMALHLRVAGKVDTNPWNASSLEWLPLDNYAARSIPRVESLDPIWDQPGLREQVAQGQHYLPGSATGARETIVTSAVEARPDYLMILPSFGWWHWLAALFTAAHFLLLTVQLYWIALVAGGLAIASILCWVWPLDPEPRQRVVDVGGGCRLEVGATGANSHSGWAVVILMLVAGSIYASLGFAYFYYWTISEGAWPPAGLTLPAPSWPAQAALALIGSSALAAGARRLLDRERTAAALALLVAALVLLLAGLGLETWGHVVVGLDPTAHAYAATVWTALALAAVLAATLLVMTGLCVARGVCGILHVRRRATFDCTVLLWHYAVAQSLCGIIVIHLAPRLLT